ncbi:uncharacterized protein VTP21DRAFT_7697 [Calcarisporiella thermophila]|uniref:uncharacterized protein n=1 Tax=Calcarisporiella thermophila TaxID=911321 RepID=UPI003743DF0A
MPEIGLAVLLRIGEGGGRAEGSFALVSNGGGIGWGQRFAAKFTKRLAPSARSSMFVAAFVRGREGSLLFAGLGSGQTWARRVFPGREVTGSSGEAGRLVPTFLLTHRLLAQPRFLPAPPPLAKQPASYPLLIPNSPSSPRLSAMATTQLPFHAHQFHPQTPTPTRRQSRQMAFFLRLKYDPLLRLVADIGKQQRPRSRPHRVQKPFGST